MKILVTGSRGWTDANAIETALSEYPDDSEVIHGGAYGADEIAHRAAIDRGMGVQTFPPDWDRHGRAAGPIRNCQMLDTQPDLVLAFWDGTSAGTKQCIAEADKRGIPVRIFREWPRRAAQGDAE